MDLSKRFSQILYDYMKIIIILKILEGFCIANRDKEDVGYILYFLKKINRLNNKLYNKIDRTVIDFDNLSKFTHH